LNTENHQLFAQIGGFFMSMDGRYATNAGSSSVAMSMDGRYGDFGLSKCQRFGISPKSRQSLWRWLNKTQGAVLWRCIFVILSTFWTVFGQFRQAQPFTIALELTSMTNATRRQA
jgi:hypothetical protein